MATQMPARPAQLAALTTGLWAVSLRGGNKGQGFLSGNFRDRPCHRKSEREGKCGQATEWRLGSVSGRAVSACFSVCAL